MVQGIRFEVNYTEIGNSNDWAGKANQGNSDIIMLGARGLKDPNNVYVEGWGFAPVTKALNDAFYRMILESGQRS